jgi:RNA polymerase sigma-70 factor (ECF subfamily)
MAPPLDFEAWYSEQYPDVVALLATVAGDVDVARDAAAEAFALAYRRRERITTMEAPSRWLYSLALDAERRRSSKQGRARALRRVLRRPPRPRVELVALIPEAREAVGSLPPPQRTAVALRYVLDLPEAEVAEVMGVTRGEASATLLAARREIISRLPADADVTEVEAGG